MEKDWTGNKATTFAILGASNHCDHEREVNDYYATDPKAVQCLFGVEEFSNIIIEPACGQGHLSKEMQKAGKTVFSYDMVDRGFGVVQDFFERKAPYRQGVDIITNPPYSKAVEFAEHGIELLQDGQKMALFLKIQFLESNKRRKFFEKYPPKTVYVFTNRVLCAMNGEFEKYKSSPACYCWFVWQKGFHGDPVIKWIN